MIVLQSLCGPGLVVILLLCGNSLVFGFEDGASPLATEYGVSSVPPVPTFEPDECASGLSATPPRDATVLSDPGVRIDCQCSPEKHRPNRFFGWFRGHAKKDSVAKVNAPCAECNVNPEPLFGASYTAIMQSQVAKGDAALMVLHDFDFVPCQDGLNFRGRLQLQKIARRALYNPFPIIIEASRSDPDLDAARHAAVISELAFLPFAAERVVIGPDLVRGMDGLDAQLIHQNLLRLTGDGNWQPSATGAGAPSPP